MVLSEEDLDRLIETLESLRTPKPKVGDMVYAWQDNPIDGFVYGRLIEVSPFGNFNISASGFGLWFGNISKDCPI